MKIDIDIVSDLHIDNWDLSLTCKYPCGERNNYPMIQKYNKNKILIIAGDISDDYNLSISYLDKISKYYKKNLFVDGNHESIIEYPRLLTKKLMKINLDNIKNNKLIHLTNKSYIINNTVFVGVCGWWNYNVGKEYIDDYFKNWIDFNKNETQIFHSNVHIKSLIEYYYLVEELNKFQNNINIDNIVIVTHTLPHRRYCKELVPNGKEKSFSDLLNTNFETINKKNYSKITHWIFGHIHNEYNEIVMEFILYVIIVGELKIIIELNIKLQKLVYNLFFLEKKIKLFKY